MGNIPTLLAIGGGAVVLIVGFVFAICCRVRRSRPKTHTGIAMDDEYEDEEEIDPEDPDDSSLRLDGIVHTGYGAPRRVVPSGYGIVHTGYGCVSPGGGSYNEEMNMLEERTSII